MAAMLRLRSLSAAIERRLPPKMQKMWNHEAGPKTIFFWAPLMKWGLAIAGAGDMMRPAEKLSVAQSMSLATTGCIWARYCLIITPRVWSLFWVQIAILLVGSNQLFRIWQYKRSLGVGFLDDVPSQQKLPEVAK